MWVLLVCALVALWLMSDRLLYFFRRSYRRRRFLSELIGALEKNNGSTVALEFSRDQNHLPALSARAYLEHLEEDAELRNDIIKREGNVALANAEKRLRLLAIIAQAAPLLGLLGTVLGMVRAFAQLEKLAGSANPGDLAGGIWVALLTTVFGLVVAIPTMAFHHWYEGWVDQMAHEMENVVSILNEWFDKKGRDDV